MEHKDPNRQPHKSLSGCISKIFIGIFLSIILTIFLLDESTESQVKETQESYYNKECFTPWHGLNHDLKTRIRDNLYFRKSFKHIETLIYPGQSTQDYHTIEMAYSAKSKIGLEVYQKVKAEIRNSDCKVITFWQVE